MDGMDYETPTRLYESNERDLIMQRKNATQNEQDGIFLPMKNSTNFTVIVIRRPLGILFMERMPIVWQSDILPLTSEL